VARRLRLKVNGRELMPYNARFMEGHVVASCPVTSFQFRSSHVESHVLCSTTLSTRHVELEIEAALLMAEQKKAKADLLRLCL
jgi:hypothetical protein